jgi:hypothetical protein
MQRPSLAPAPPRHEAVSAGACRNGTAIEAGSYAYSLHDVQRSRPPASRGSSRAYPLGVEGLPIDRRLQRHGRRVAQGGQSEAGRFGSLDELSHPLGRLVAVER